MTDDDTYKVCITAITASILVAFSDGKMSQEERDRLIDILGADKKKTMSPREILGLVEQCVSKVKEVDAEAWPNIMATIAQEFSDESKNFILTAARNMALVDGEITEAEQEKIQQIARWIGTEEQI